MITFTMREATEYWRANYGLLFESVETVEVTGNAAHNPHYPHRVQVWESKRCNRAGTHVLQAESIVIANTPVERSPRLGTVREGDTVRLVYPDGTSAEYTVTAQWLRDPRLTPVDSAKIRIRWTEVSRHDAVVSKQRLAALMGITVERLNADRPR